MTTHSSIVAWRISWTEEFGGLSPWGRKELDTTEAMQWLQNDTNRIVSKLCGLTGSSGKRFCSMCSWLQLRSSAGLTWCPIQSGAHVCCPLAKVSAGSSAGIVSWSTSVLWVPSLCALDFLKPGSWTPGVQTIQKQTLHIF